TLYRTQRNCVARKGKEICCVQFSVSCNSSTTCLSRLSSFPRLPFRVQHLNCISFCPQPRWIILIVHLRPRPAVLPVPLLVHHLAAGRIRPIGGGQNWHRSRIVCISNFLRNQF